MSLIYTIVIGALGGWIGSKLFSGAGKGLLIDIIIGIVGGALAGSVLGGALFDGLLGEILLSVIGSVALLWVISLIAGKK